MRIQPASFAFMLLLGLLASVPYSGIDMNLPALAATGAALGARAADVGLTLSVFMLSLAMAPLVYGPVSDRYGRRPVVVFGVTLFVVGSLACALAQSLPVLLVCRFSQGCGAASTTLTFAIIRDLFEGENARAKMANVVIAVNAVTVIAPTAGAALLALGSWRLIYTIQFVMGLGLLTALVTGFAESAKIDQTNRLAPSIIGRSYLQVLTHPISFAYILVSSAGGTVMAYVTGSSCSSSTAWGCGLTPWLIFSACSDQHGWGFLDRRLAVRTSHLPVLMMARWSRRRWAIPRHDTGRLGTAATCCFTSGRCCRCLRIEHTERHARDDASVAAGRRRGRRCVRKHSDDGRRRLKRARCVSLRRTISAIDGRGHDAVFASGACILSADCPSRRASRFAS